MKYDLPEAVLANLEHPYPHVLERLVNEASGLAPDCEREIYGWLKPEIEIVHSIGSNLLARRARQEKTHEGPFVEQLEGLDEVCDTLGGLVENEKKQQEILRAFGEKKGTPFGSYISKSKKADPSRSLENHSMDPFWVGLDLSKTYEGIVSPYFQIGIIEGSPNAELRVGFYWLIPETGNPASVGMKGTLELERHNSNICVAKTRIKKIGIPETFNRP